MKRTLILLFLIGIIAVGWTFGWQLAANQVAVEIETSRERLASMGRDIACKGQDISGFPFRISLNCGEIEYYDSNIAFGISAGALKTAAQVYQPGKMVGELDGPAEIRIPDGRRFDVEWSSMRSSLSVGLDGLDRFSLLGKDLDIRPGDPLTDQARAGELQIHGRRIDDEDIQLAVRSRDVSSPQARWPSFDLAVTGQFKGILQDILEQPDLVRIGRREGLEGRILKLEYSLVSGGSVSLEGPFSVDRNGILTGRFDIASRENGKLLEALREVLPEQRELLDQAAPIVMLLEGQGKGGGLKVNLTVNRGNASLSLIPIGQIPPLY